MTRMFKGLLAILLLLALTVVAAAEDLVVLKNGKEYRGEVIEETKEIVRMKVDIGGIAQTLTFWKDDVKTLTRDAGQEKPDADIRPKGDPVKATSGSKDQAPTQADLVNKKVFVIPMYGGVGQTFRQDKLKEAIDAARPFKPDVIVLEIDSPGGALSEVYKLRDYIEKVRDEFRIVVWIKSAISAAAMTSMMCREMYFMKEGHIGAATAWYMTGSGAKAMEGLELEIWLRDAREFAEKAGYHPYVTQAMIDPRFILTAKVEELPNGERRVTFYDDYGDGREILCKEGEILTLTASQAERYNISLGTVDDKEEFARMLNLSGWVEVSDAGRKITLGWKDLYERFEKEFTKLVLEYNNPASNIDDRIRIVRDIMTWLRRDPALAEWRPMPDYSGPLDYRDLDRLLKALVRQKG